MSVEARSSSVETLSSFCLTRNIVSTGAQRQSALSQLQCMATMAKYGVEALFEGNLDRFDALVGENSCQIRASQIFDLATSFSNEAPLRQKLLEEKAKVEQVLERIKIMQREPITRKMPQATLIEFATQNGVDLELSEETALLTQCFFLTFLKRQAPKGVLYSKDEIDREILTREFGMSKSCAHDLCQKNQIQLSERSVGYLQAQAKRIEEFALLSTLVGPEFIKADLYKRKVSPFLFCYAVLMKRAIEKGMPIIVNLRLAKGEKITKVECMLFEPRDGSYVFSPLDKADLSKPALVIEGNAIYQEDDPTIIEEVQKRLLQTDLAEIVLANAAIHPQYPGCKDQTLQVEQFEEEDIVEEIDEFRQLALKGGFCQENASTFCIDHVFCDRMINQVKKCKT